MTRSDSVWFLISDMGRGGSQKVCSTLVCELASQGHHVGLMTMHGGRGDWPLPQNLKVDSFNCNHARFVLPDLVKWLRSRRPGTILVFNHQLAVLLVLARFLSRSNVTIVARNISNLSQKYTRESSSWHTAVVNPLVKLLYRRIDLVVAQSRGMAEDLMANYGFPEQKIKLLHNPVVMPLVPKDEVAANHHRHEFLFVGRLEPVKNLAFLLGAFSLLQESLNEVHLTIVGDGSERKALADLCVKLGIVDQVAFVGWQKPEKYFAACDVVVLTSHYEGFPNVLIESMAHGKPVVSVDCPSGPSEVIQHGVNGFLVRTDELHQYAQSMRMAALQSWDTDRVRFSIKEFKADSVALRYWELLCGVGT